MIIKKFEQRVEKLAEKITISKTPVPGFVMGLSGTDSIVTFLLCYEALKKHGLQQNLIGRHFIETVNTKTWFSSYIIPWLKERCPETLIEARKTISGLNDNEDQWHDLVFHSKDYKLWLAASVNATEKYLGTYSILSKSASIWPVATIWKSDIMAMCYALEVPDIAMEMSRIPDCICGRDELAAENIELIDEIIQHKVDPTKYDPELLGKLIAWVRDTKNTYDFKDRTPYII